VCRIEERSHQLRLKLAEEEKKALHEFQAAIQQAEDRLIAQVCVGANFYSNFLAARFLEQRRNDTLRV
jgi:hypothetical protein